MQVCKCAGVHLWTIDQRNVSAVRLQEMRLLLNDAEREKVARFRFESLQKTAVISHASLRIILSRYLPSPPQAIQFVTNAHGKPSLFPLNELQFNVAHSGDFVLIVVAKTAVGVDIEQTKPNIEYGMIAQRYFSAWETAVFQQLPVADQPAAFYRCWTRKEAYLKGIGTGLTTALDSFDVEFRANKEPQLLQTRHHPANAEKWRLVDVETAVGYTAALAVKGSGGGRGRGDCQIRHGSFMRKTSLQFELFCLPHSPCDESGFPSRKQPDLSGATL